MVVYSLTTDAPGAVDATNSPLLNLDRIFTGKDFNAKSFGPFQWRRHGGGYTTLEKPSGDEPGQDLVWHDPSTGKKTILVPARLFAPPGETTPLPVSGYTFSDDDSKLLIYTNDKKVWRQKSRGDYWVLDIPARLLTKLGGKGETSSMMYAAFSPDGGRVCYVRENNLYVQNLRDLAITRLTFDGSETVMNGRFDWVYEEELFLQSGFRWSPDGSSIAYWQTDTHGVSQFSLVNDTDQLYPQVARFDYPKAGEINPLVRVGVVGAGGGSTTWLKVPGDPRDHYIAKMEWAGKPGEIGLQQFNRLQNTNLVMLSDSRSGSTRTILTETDAAWVENENKPWWTKDQREFVWLSERDGWRHAWLVSHSGGSISLITKGSFDVEGIAALDETNRVLYFSASPENATQRYLYSVPLDGGKARRLTPKDEPGTHTYDISPDARHAVHTYSAFGMPPVTDLISLPDHKRVEWLEENSALKTKVEALAKSPAEFFRVDVGGGVSLDGWCVKPPGFDPSKKYPVLFHVYGEPAGQTVTDRWGGDGYLWNLMLAQQGYVVMSVDNQGTPAPRGRDWRKAVYRRIGTLASAQQAGAVRALTRARPYLDPKRVAVWGWSGGGSMSLNLIFRQPEVYQTAMAVAPVPNIRYYDTIYQERYMGLPQDNPEDYRLSSPITFAGQLEGHLLLVHGTGDDNVHYQGSEALINDLVALNKPFSMMAYPNRTHAISEGRNTRRHLYGLLTDYLHQHTPPNPESAGK